MTNKISRDSAARSEGVAHMGDRQAILEASPSVGSYKARPFTVAEIDAHQDADRIWATLSLIRD